MSGAIPRFALLFTALCCGGCAGVPFTVEAVRTHAPDVHPLSYQIECPAQPPRDPTIFYDIAKSYARAALSSKGMFEASAGTTPEMIVEIDFAVEVPRIEVRTSTSDVTEWVAATTTTVTETTKQANGTATTSTRTVTEPAHSEKVGEETHEEEVEIFPMFFRMTAREYSAKPGERGRQLWSVYVTHEDLKNDLDAFLPMMIAAAMDYIDRQTNEEKTVEISNKDRRLSFVLRGMPASDAFVKQVATK